MPSNEETFSLKKKCWPGFWHNRKLSAAFKGNDSSTCWLRSPTNNNMYLFYIQFVQCCARIALVPLVTKIAKIIKNNLLYDVRSTWICILRLPGPSSTGTSFLYHMMYGRGTPRAKQASIRVLLLFTSWLVRFWLSQGRFLTAPNKTKQKVWIKDAVALLLSCSDSDSSSVASCFFVFLCVLTNRNISFSYPPLTYHPQ